LCPAPPEERGASPADRRAQRSLPVRERQEVQEVSRQLAGECGPLPIVWENDQIIVVDKPAGWLSVPSRLGAADARPWVGGSLQAQLGAKLSPPHRLDEEVSGLLLFARSAAAHRLLCSGFESRSIDKSYVALCAGTPPAGLRLGETRRVESQL